jgi:hypothetical protein
MRGYSIAFRWAIQANYFKSAHSGDNYCPKLSGVGGGPAVNGAVGGALATGSGGLGFGGDSFAIFESSLFGFWFLALVDFFVELLSAGPWLRWYCSLCWLLLYESSSRTPPIPPIPMPIRTWAFAVWDARPQVNVITTTAAIRKTNRVANG